MVVINSVIRVYNLIRYMFSSISDLKEDEILMYKEALAFSTRVFTDFNPLIVSGYKFLLVYEDCIKRNKRTDLLYGGKLENKNILNKIYFNILRKRVSNLRSKKSVHI